MNLKKTLTITLLLTASLSIAFAQDIMQNIRGTVIDKYSQIPIPGASVVLLESNPVNGTISDINGEFILQNVPIGRQAIQVSYMGFKTFLVNNLNVSSGKEIVINVQLIENVIQTDEVVISASGRKHEALNKMATVSARTFTVEETERFAGSLGDPSRMAANYAGVSMVSDTRNDIIIRGNSPSGLLWRLDGVEIPNPNHFGAAGTTGGPVSMLNNNLLTNSDFFTGAFPAEYGNAISGVFDLNMRAGNTYKREYVGQIGFNGFELGAEGPFSDKHNSSYLANYRYSTLGVMSAMGLNFGAGSAIPQYQDLTFKLDFAKTKIGKFSLIGLGGISYIELNDSENVDADTDDESGYNLLGTDVKFGSNTGVVGLTHLYFFNTKTRIKTILAVQGNSSSTQVDSLRFDSAGTVIEGSGYKFYRSSYNEIKYSVSTHLKTKFDSKNNLNIGAYFDLYSLKNNDTVFSINTDVNSFNVEGSLSIIRAYVQWQHNFSDNLMLNSGLYSQMIKINNEVTAEPRLGLKYNITNTQSISLGYGLHSQMLARHFYFLQTKLENDDILYTNKDVKTYKSHQLVLAYEKLFSENVRFKSELYYQYLFDVPVVESNFAYSILNSGDDFYSSTYDSLVNEGTGKNYGIEFTFEKFFSKGYYFLMTASLFESKYSGFDGVERNTAFNGNFVYNALAGYEFKIGNNSLTIDVKGVYAGGKRYIPIDIEASAAVNQAQYNWSSAFENRFEDYFRADLRIGFKMNKKKFNQEWAIDLQNVTDNKNIYRQTYNPRNQTVNYDYQTGFFPMFLYRIQF
ncbi:MAG TPA: TonB-dependent receptor [Bacteroidales bacterium]|nr:MAG: hypothetical protein A2W98_10145 [Bacteroidetes bacterium GWF2_33_38]OFY76352.1 MAG: hypothetical protein A2265_11885 [Bacteroidetes bacterium RIFOXYA12_FULL_33_9]HBF89309.1 TonB-dependent receptor [Bacteroidales bacterium]